MLIFDGQFHGACDLGCSLWANEATFGRVRFDISRTILMDVLKGGNPANDGANIRLCNNNRSRIETACQRAFENRPNAHVILETSDFI
jgi:hypothetical protein